MTSIRTFCTRVAMAAAMVMAVLLAATPASAADLSAAEAAFARAQTAFAAGDYDGAAAAFQEANAIRPLPEFQFNTAICYQQKGKQLNDAAAYQQAIDYYARYLIAAGDAAADKGVVDQTISVLKAEIATLAAAAPGTVTAPSAPVAALGPAVVRGVVVIESNPSSASIYLGDRSAGVFARTPWSGPLPAGKHTLIVEIQGYETREITIDAAPDRLVAKTVDLPLAPTLGWLDITSNVVGAQVYFDDKTTGALGVTPLGRNFPPGPHKLIISADGYDDFVEDIEIKAGESRKVDAQLAGAPVGYLSVSGDGIQRAQIYVDGKLACDVGPCKKGVREGRRSLEVRRSGYKPYRRAIEVKAGNETTIKVAFAPEPSRVDAIVTYVLAAALGGTGVGLYLHGGKLEDQDPTDKQADYFKYGAYGAWGIGGITLLTAVYYTFRDKGPPSKARVDTQQLPTTTAARIRAGLRPEVGPGYVGGGLALTW
jgi:hypothetical protein